MKENINKAKHAKLMYKFKPIYEQKFEKELKGMPKNEQIYALIDKAAQNMATAEYLNCFTIAIDGLNEAIEFVPFLTKSVWLYLVNKAFMKKYRGGRVTPKYINKCMNLSIKEQILSELRQSFMANAIACNENKIFNGEHQAPTLALKENEQFFIILNKYVDIYAGYKLQMQEELSNIYKAVYYLNNGMEYQHFYKTAKCTYQINYMGRWVDAHPNAEMPHACTVVSAFIEQMELLKAYSPTAFEKILNLFSSQPYGNLNNVIKMAA